MKVCVVTCTGGRPELFALCRKWVERQIRKADAWVVTTDTGEKPAIPDWANFVSVPPLPDTWSHLPCAGAAFALSTALTHLPSGHAVVVMEDDDWYSAEHIRRACIELDRHEIVQLSNLYRWHLPEARYMHGVLGGPTQSLMVPGITSFRSSAIESVRDALQYEPFGKLPIHFYDGGTCVSIKGVGYGLPGRAGATRKHLPHHHKTRKGALDIGLTRFRSMTFPDGESYVHLLRS